MLLTITTNKEWPLHQFDMENVFHHSDIQKVYMEALPSFSQDFSGNEGCKLRKALYGLKQSPRA